VVRITADSTGSSIVTVRLKYEWSDRQGSDFIAHVLEAVEEQPAMRHFDVANRRRQRATAIFTVTPVSWIALSGSVAGGRDDYADTGFGLRDNRNRSYGLGADLPLRETVTLGIWGEREKYTANQYSRTANPGAQFNDPRRDWSLDTTDRADTVTASLDLLRTIPKMDVRLAYDLSDGEATYLYGLAPDQTVFTTVPLAQLPRVRNRLTGARADVQYFIRPDVAVGVAYRYEDYAVRDFALDATNMRSLVAGSSAIYSGYLYRPYTAHTAWLRLTYLW
jgi:hypothetical protein